MMGAAQAQRVDAPASGQGVEAQASGVIFGSVTDSDGDLVPGAVVTLIRGAKKRRTSVTDGEGRFQFSGVGAGAFEIMATAQGMARGMIRGTMAEGAVVDAPPIVLRVETANTELTVRPLTEYQIAEQEVKTEEKQRVLAIVPNYFVTYDQHPVPLTAKQKYGLGLRVVLDPTHFAFSAIAAGFEQETNAFPGYGRGPQGYGKRYGADLATSTVSSLLRGSVYPSLFHQDPRYFYKGSGTVWQRTKYALATAVICKGDNGRWEPNYSSILGDLSAGALANVYYAPSDRHGAALTFENGLLSIAGEGVGHLAQEFLFRKLTRHTTQAGTP
jgi:hypothetical protein